MAKPGVGGGERGTWLDIKEDQILRVGGLGSTDLAGFLLIRYVSAGGEHRIPEVRALLGRGFRGAWLQFGQGEALCHLS